MNKYPTFRTEVYLDGASKEEIISRSLEGFVKGFTTNPTLMAKAGITNYEGFAREILAEVPDRPVSFEVFSDDLKGMERQAKIIASWGKNVFVKIPVTNTKGEPCYSLVSRLTQEGVKLNVTAVFTPNQIVNLRECLHGGADSIVSIFAGRIADTGVDPMPIMKNAVSVFEGQPQVKILWASPREVLNIYQANECGCHIITATNDLIKKLSLHGKPLSDYSMETVKMFFDDGQRAGFEL